MMQLKKLFTPVSSMDAEEAKAYMAGHREGEYTLLDVRQPGEYEDAHLPGAKLMPLPGLSDTYQELDPEKPTIVLLRHRRPQPGGGPDALRLGVQGGLQPGGRHQGLSRAQGHRPPGTQPGPGQGRRDPGADHHPGLRDGKGPAALLRNPAAAIPGPGITRSVRETGPGGSEPRAAAL